MKTISRIRTITVTAVVLSLALLNHAPVVSAFSTVSSTYSSKARTATAITSVKATRRPGRTLVPFLDPPTTALFLTKNTDTTTTTSSSSWSTPLDRPVLAGVDLLSLLVFAAVGKASHAANGELDPLAVLGTAAPFVVSWFLTSPLSGVYDPRANRRRRPSDNIIVSELQTAAKGWILSVPLGIVFRGVIKGYVPPVPFIIVTLIATLVILGGARVLFSVVEDFFVELVN